MNSMELSRMICNSLSDGYDDEETGKKRKRIYTMNYHNYLEAV